MPLERAVLDQQLAGIPNSAAWAKRPEIDQMAAVMMGGEHVLAGATGWLIESGKLAMRTWLVVATTQRLLCLLKSRPQGFRQVEVPIKTMKSAYTDARLGYHEVIVETDKSRLVLSGMPKESAVSLAGALNQAIGLKSSAAAPARPSQTTTYAVPPATTAMAEAASLTPLPMLDDNGGEMVSRDEIETYVQTVKKLAAELESTKKRLAAVEDVIRRAAARSAAAAKPGS